MTVISGVDGTDGDIADLPPGRDEEEKGTLN